MKYAIEDHNMSTKGPQPQALYEIKIQGQLDQSWQAYFNDLSAVLTHPDGLATTTLIAPIVDQPALRGLLCKLWDLNLTLISVRQLATDWEKKEKENE